MESVQITLNEQLGNHLNKDIMNASISLSSFPFSGCFHPTNDLPIYSSNIRLGRDKHSSLFVWQNILMTPTKTIMAYI
jgi:hypothetical protein